MSNGPMSDEFDAAFEQIRAAYIEGLTRGLELAKEHAEIETVTNPGHGQFDTTHIDWKAADDAVAREGK